MLDDLPYRLRPWVYYALVLAMSIAVALAPGASTSVAMLTPLVAALLMLLVVTREGWGKTGWAGLGLHRAGLRHWALAIGVPIVVVGGAHVALWLSDAATAGANEATNGSGFLMLPLVLVTNIVFASVTVSLTEEIGWRGYLLPRLTSYGTRRALLISGFLWGVWHLPIILLTGLYHPDGSRWVVVPLFLVSVTAAGVFVGWLRLRSKSIWPAVLAHSANNAAAAGFGAYTIASPVIHEYLAGESGVITALGYVAVALWLLARHPIPDPVDTGADPLLGRPVPRPTSGSSHEFPAPGSMNL